MYELDREAVKDFLDNHAALFALLDEILDSPRATPPFDADAMLEEILDEGLPYVVKWRQMGWLLMARVRYIAETEGINQGLDAMARAYPLAGLYQDSPHNVSGMAGSGVQSMMKGAARSFAAQPANEADPETIRRLARVIAETKSLSPSFGMQSERALLTLPLASDDAWRNLLVSHADLAGNEPGVDLAMSLTGMERWKTYAQAYAHFDPFMPHLARLERDPDDREARGEIDRFQRKLEEVLFYDPSRRAEYSPYIVLFPISFGLLADVYLQGEADRRLTVFGLNLWADALEGKPLAETLPLEPEFGTPILMERAEDRITLRSGLRGDPRWPSQTIMTIRLPTATSAQ